MQNWKAWFNQSDNQLTINVIGEVTTVPNLELCLCQKSWNSNELHLEVKESEASNPPLKQPRFVHFCEKIQDLSQVDCVCVFYNNEEVARMTSIEVVCQELQTEPVA